MRALFVVCGRPQALCREHQLLHKIISNGYDFKSIGRCIAAAAAIDLLCIAAALLVASFFCNFPSPILVLITLQQNCEVVEENIQSDQVVGL